MDNIDKFLDKWKPKSEKGIIAFVISFASDKFTALGIFSVLLYIEYKINPNLNVIAIANYCIVILVISILLSPLNWLRNEKKYNLIKKINNL